MSELRPKLNHDKGWYTEQLRSHVCVVEFEKVDGTFRTMICTTKSEQLPVTGATGKTVTVPEHQVRVYDVQKQAWRSFNIDTVVSFSVVEED